MDGLLDFPAMLQNIVPAGEDTRAPSSLRLARQPELRYPRPTGSPRSAPATPIRTAGVPTRNTGGVPIGTPVRNAFPCRPLRSQKPPARL